MIFLTGGSGYVGNRVIACLKEQHASDQLYLLQNKSLLKSEDGEIVASSLEDLRPEAIKGKIDCIIHLATKTRPDNTSDNFESNVLGAKKIVAIAKSKGVSKIIYLSSTGVYGHGGFRDIDESFITNPTTALSKSRLEAESVLDKWAKSTGNKLLILRPRFVIGANDKFMLPSLIKAAKSYRVLPGGGKNLVSIIDVDDLAKTICLLAGASPYEESEILNVSNGQSLSMQEILKIISLKLGYKTNRYSIPFLIPYAFLRIRELITRTDPESIPAGKMSSLRLKMSTMDNHVSSRKLQELLNEKGFSFREFDESLEQYLEHKKP